MLAQRRTRSLSTPCSRKVLSRLNSQIQLAASKVGSGAVGAVRETPFLDELDGRSGQPRALAVETARYRSASLPSQAPSGAIFRDSPRGPGAQGRLDLPTRHYLRGRDAPCGIRFRPTPRVYEAGAATQLSARKSTNPHYVPKPSSLIHSRFIGFLLPFLENTRLPASEARNRFGRPRRAARSSYCCSAWDQSTSRQVPCWR